MMTLAISLPLILLCVSVVLLPALFLARSVTVLRVIEIVLCVSCCVSFMLFAYWIWFFRDGLKAGFIPTEGAAAWARFAQGFWLPFLLLAAVVALSVFFYRNRFVRLSGQPSNQALEPTADRLENYKDEI